MSIRPKQHSQLGIGHFIELNDCVVEGIIWYSFVLSDQTSC